jgi:hypothetical protein
MSPIREADLQTKFIVVDARETLGDAFLRLEDASRGINGDWFVVIRGGKGLYVVLTAGELLSLYYDRVSKEELLGDLVDWSNSDASIQQGRVFGIDEGRDLMRRSPRQRLVVEEGDRVVGLLVEVERGAVEPPEPPSPIRYPPYISEVNASGESTGTVTTGDDQTAAAPPRYANLCLTSSDGEFVLPRTTDLMVEREYSLRLDIGPLSQNSVVANALEHPVPVNLLPETMDGHWLQAVVVSDEFTLNRRRFNLFLPRIGPSWVCDCLPGSQHTCEIYSRQQYLYISLRAPSQTGPAHLRLSLYYQNNLVQSQMFTANIAEEEQMGEGFASIIDYTLNGKLDDLSYLPERKINILTSLNSDGTHRIVINGLKQDVLAFTLSEGSMGGAVNAVRQALRDIHYSEGQGRRAEQRRFRGFMQLLRNALRAQDMDLESGFLGERHLRVNLFDQNNAKPIEAFIADLKLLARLGWILYLNLLKSNTALENEHFSQELAEPASIQISRPSSSSFVFPWGMIYDIPLETSQPQNYRLCSLVEEWETLKDSVVGHTTTGCPYRVYHTMNTICPFGFWGFRHIIEQPPSTPPDGRLRMRIHRRTPMNFVAALSTNLDPELTSTHLRNICQDLPVFQVQQFASLEQLKEAIASPELEILYFYCHGLHQKISGTDIYITYLDIGSGEPIEPADIGAWSSGLKLKQLWKKVSPLVFINGCHTIDLIPEALVDFVDAFSLTYASGVIGTEITIHQRIAGEAAEQFLKNFSDQLPVGQALQRMRLNLLSKGNLMGLAYTAYCSADLALG